MAPTSTRSHFLEAVHLGAQLGDDADGLVAQGQALPLSDAAPESVHVGRADEGAGGRDRGVIGAGSRDGLVDEADLADPLHHKGSHHPRHRHNLIKI
jgi:hypothetical protein